MAAGPLPLFDINLPTYRRPPKRRTRQFLGYAAECDVYLPSYWSRSQWNNDQRELLVDVDSKVKSAITDTIVQTWEPDLVGQGSDGRGLVSCDIEVVSVSRFEAPWLYSNYLQERRKLFAECHASGMPCPDIQGLFGSRGRVKSMESLPNFMKQELYWEVNEHYLFHGTKAKNLQSILSSGLDPVFSSPYGMFGRAVYTTESFTKADQYTDSKEARSKPGTDLYMILARVLLGRVYVCASKKEKQNLQGPPCTVCLRSNCHCWFPPRYGSVMMDGNWLFRLFAVHYRNSCYPEYFIKYKRKDKRDLLGEC